MATVSIIFEASIFTADLSKMDFKKWLALGSRIALVLIAARITAAPFHVLFFMDRLRRERVLSKVSKRVFYCRRITGFPVDLEKTVLNEGQAGVVKEDQDEVEQKSALVSSSIESLEKEVEACAIKHIRIDKNKIFLETINRKKGDNRTYTILRSLAWAKTTSLSHTGWMKRVILYSGTRAVCNDRSNKKRTEIF